MSHYSVTPGLGAGLSTPRQNQHNQPSESMGTPYGNATTPANSTTNRKVKLNSTTTALSDLTGVSTQVHNGTP